MSTQTGSDWKIKKVDSNIGLAKHILLRLFKDYKDSFIIHLWNGSQLHVGTGSPAFTLAIKHYSVLRHLVLFNDPIRLAEAYFDGTVEVTGDFNAAIKIF